MIYPTITEYIEAIRFSEDNFDKLTNLVPVLKDNGEPYYSSGNFAVVFKMKDKESGKLHAVKCFLKDQEGREERYKLIAVELDKVDSPYILKIKYLDKELFVDSKSTDETEFPVLLMDWVEGVPLDKYIRDNIKEYPTITILLLAHCFCEMAKWLLTQPFAHGDLKPDNIIVRDNGLITLVDYDGMFVPQLLGYDSIEIGSPDFQNPNRTIDCFDKHIDDLGLLSIALSLNVISSNPIFLDQYGSSDRLLFSSNDYKNLYQSNVFKRLISIGYDNSYFDLLFLMQKILSGGFLMEEDFSKFYLGLDIEITYCWSDIGNFPYFDFFENWQLFCESHLDDYDITTLYALSLIYHSEDQKAKGIHLLYEGVVHNNPSALLALGLCYFEGEGVSRNYNSAFEYFLKAYDNGGVGALFFLGYCYSNGIGITLNFEKAYFYWDKFSRLGLVVHECTDVFPDSYIKFKRNIIKAKTGDMIALYELGESYEIGYCVSKDLDKAFGYYTKSAEQGNARAQCKLGLLYEFQYENIAEAIKWYTKSALQWDDEALCTLLGAYEYGEGNANDLKNLVQWLVSYSNECNSKAQYFLGFCYEKGLGVVKNLHKANRLISQSAEQGYHLAIRWLNSQKDKIDIDDLPF